MSTKHCSRCKQFKSLSRFYRNPNARYQSHKYSAYCKECFAEVQKDRRLRIKSSEPTTIDKACKGCGIKKSSSEFHVSFQSADHLSTRCKKCSEKYYAYSLGKRLKVYGLTPKDYARMLSEQNNRCALCSCEESRSFFGKTYTLCVDHDHKTLKPRKLLCARCNYAVGGLEHLARNGLLEIAVKYLQDS